MGKEKKEELRMHLSHGEVRGSRVLAEAHAFMLVGPEIAGHRTW